MLSYISHMHIYDFAIYMAAQLQLRLMDIHSLFMVEKILSTLSAHAD